MAEARGCVVTRLTEHRLAAALLQHEATCETCEAGEECDDRRRIEASFWNEVDMQIDEARCGERRR